MMTMSRCRELFFLFN